MMLPLRIIIRGENRSKSHPAGGEVNAPITKNMVAGKVTCVSLQPNVSISSGYSNGSVCMVMPFEAM